MRSFTYYLFYESKFRTELARNLLSMVNKAHDLLTKKLQSPFILKEHFSGSHDFFVRSLLFTELTAQYKRTLIVELFKMTMPEVEDVEIALRILQDFEMIRVEQDNLKKEDQKPVPRELEDFGTEWHSYIFPGFDYQQAAADEYNKICEYLAFAFSRAAYDHGIKNEAKKGLEIEHFAFDKLPKPLRDSIKNPDRYQQRFNALQYLNNLYITITDEKAATIYTHSDAFKKLRLSGYTNCYTMAEILSLKSPSSFDPLSRLHGFIQNFTHHFLTS